MSGIDDPDAPDATPPEVPEEYAAVYRDAYLRALQEDGGELAPAPEDGFEVIVAPAANRPGRGRLLPVIVAGTVLLLLLGAFVVAKIATGDDEPAAGVEPDDAVTDQDHRIRAGGADLDTVGDPGRAGLQPGCCRWRLGWAGGADQS